MNHASQNPKEEEVPDLLSIAQIEKRFAVTRQTVHNLRRRGVFPEPVTTPGSTRLRWDAVTVAAYFAANPKQPGKKIEKRLKPTDVTPPNPEQ